ncbi:MAG: DUF4349 domain-containing protein [Flavobacteriales bacterium]|nr:DUF4349 domain-containing protein [Flavobacteriales bacterium]
MSPQANISGEAEQLEEKAPDISKAPLDRKIIREGEIRFETNDASKTGELITNVLKKYGGYVSKDNVYDYAERIEHTLEVRVPSEYFDSLLEQVSKSAENLDSKNISARDVTEEYVDIGSRIRSKMELEARYTELLSRATTIEEILNIEREIGVLREEIESIQGRLRYLNDRVSFSTLIITFYEETRSGIGFLPKFSDAVTGGWNNLLWLLIGLTHIWPFVVILGGGVLFAIGMDRKRRNK